MRKMLFVFLFIILWEVLCKVLDISPFLLPAPSHIIAIGFEKIDVVLFHTKIFLIEVFLGILLAVIVGCFLATLSSSSKIFYDIITPIIMFLQGIPRIALAPFIIIFLGSDIYPKIFLSAFMGFFAVYLGTLSGLGSTDPDIIEVAKIYKASWWDVLWKIKIPSTIPYFFTGLKTSIPPSISGVVVGEWLAGSQGLAYFIFLQAFSFNIPLSFFAILVLSLIGVFIFYMVECVEKYFER